MSISASTVWEVRTAGNDTNGGGFVPGGGVGPVDYSQQDSKNSGGNNGSTTDAVGLGTDHITSATASFTSAIVGNIIYLQGGTGSLAAGWYQVIGLTSSTNIQLDRTVAVGTGITMNIGGALLTWGQANANCVTSNQVWIKVGTYVLTTGSSVVAGGVVDLSASGGAIGAEMKWEGYQTTRGDLGTKPVLQVPGAGVTNVTMWNGGGQFTTLRNVTFDGNSKTGIAAYYSQNFYNLAIDCRAINVTKTGFNVQDVKTQLIRCYVTNCTASYPDAAFIIGNETSTAFMCMAQDCTSAGFYFNPGCLAAFCIADTCSGGGGFIALSTGFQAWNCVAYNCDRGFDFRSGGNGRFRSVCINCIAEGNSTAGFDTDTASPGVWMFNCAGYNNGTDYNNFNLPNVYNFVTGTASFFTNAAGGDFTLNNTAGGGAAARGAGLPGLMPS